MEFSEWNVWITIKISLKFVSNGPINNIPALVQIMVWCQPGDKPLFETMMVSLLTHICVTRPHWVNSNNLIRFSFSTCQDIWAVLKLWRYLIIISQSYNSINCLHDFNHEIMKGHHSGSRHLQMHFRWWKGPVDNKWSLVRVMAWRRSGDNPLLVPIERVNTTSMEQESTRITSFGKNKALFETWKDNRIRDYHITICENIWNMYINKIKRMKVSTCQTYRTNVA